MIDEHEEQPNEAGYSAYSSASHTVRKTKQVIMLYDGAIRFVRQAKSAIEEGRIEDRYNALNRAADVMAGLQLSLDTENGGEIAELLYDYYAGIDMRLISIHSDQSLEMCDLVIKHLKMMRDAWIEIDETLASDPVLSDSGEDSVEISSESEKINGEEEDTRLSPAIDFSDPRIVQSLEAVGLSLSV